MMGWGMLVQTQNRNVVRLVVRWDSRATATAGGEEGGRGQGEGGGEKRERERREREEREEREKQRAFSANYALGRSFTRPLSFTSS